MIKNYHNFHVDRLLESINESLLYFSPPFRNMLADMDNEISKDLLDNETKDIKPDITFIDFEGSEPGYVTFNTMSNAIKKAKESTHKNALDQIDTVVNRSMIDAVWKVDKNNDEVGIYHNKSRNSVKLGRLVNRIFPSKYKDKEVEAFVNEFKSRIENEAEHFEIISGDNIATWYNNKPFESKGTLGGSCMKNGSNSFFKIYTQNPDICRLLVLVEKGIMKGRALIWKVESVHKQWGGKNDIPKFEYFLDRQYTSNESDINKFKIYAKEQGWAYKTKNSHSSPEGITTPDGQEHNVAMTIKVKPGDYNQYPYMDTFKKYNPTIGTLYNDSDSEMGCYILESTGGGFEEHGNWSDWYDENIPEDEGVYSEILDDWIWSSEAVEITLGSQRGEYLPADHEALVYDEMREEYVYEDDAIYSDYYGYYIFDEDAVETIISFERYNPRTDTLSNEDDEVMYFYSYDDKDWFKVMGRKFGWGYDYILSSLMISDRWGNDFPECLSVEVFDTIENHSYPSVEYLSKIDSHLLGITIDSNKPYIMDIVSYNMELMNWEVLDKIQPAAKSFMSQYNLEFGDDNDDKLNQLVKNMEDRVKTTQWIENEK